MNVGGEKDSSVGAPSASTPDGLQVLGQAVESATASKEAPGSAISPATASTTTGPTVTTATAPALTPLSCLVTSKESAGEHEIETVGKITAVNITTSRPTPTTAVVETRTNDGAAPAEKISSGNPTCGGIATPAAAPAHGKNLAGTMDSDSTDATAATAAAGTTGSTGFRINPWKTKAVTTTSAAADSTKTAPEPPAAEGVITAPTPQETVIRATPTTSGGGGCTSGYPTPVPAAANTAGGNSLATTAIVPSQSATTPKTTTSSADNSGRAPAQNPCKDGGNGPLASCGTREDSGAALAPAPMTGRATLAPAVVIRPVAFTAAGPVARGSSVSDVGGSGIGGARGGGGGVALDASSASSSSPSSDSSKATVKSAPAVAEEDARTCAGESSGGSSSVPQLPLSSPAAPSPCKTEQAVDQSRGGLAAAAGLLLVHHAGGVAQQEVESSAAAVDKEQGKDGEHEVEKAEMKKQRVQRPQRLGAEKRKARDTLRRETVGPSQPPVGNDNSKRRSTRTTQAVEEEEEDEVGDENEVDEEMEENEENEENEGRDGRGEISKVERDGQEEQKAVDLLPPPPLPSQSAKRKRRSPKKQLQQRQAEAAAETAATPPQKPKKKHRKLQLQPPNFEIEKHGGGKVRKRYSLDFKVKAAKYALSPDPKGQARGGTVGARYAAAQLGVPESQSVREWMRRLPEMEAELARAHTDGGEMASRHVRRKKSMSRGRVPSTHKIDAELLAFIKQESSCSPSNGLAQASAKKVSSRAVKDKAHELMPELFGVAPSWERDGDDYPAAFKRHEAKISSWCHRFLKRHRVAHLCENPLKRKRGVVGSSGRGGGGRWEGGGGDGSGADDGAGSESGEEEAAAEPEDEEEEGEEDSRGGDDE